jgi:Flp pilus assembly protein TadD
VRRLILAILLAGYAAVFVRLPSLGDANRRFDPLEPRGREVERAIEARRFSEALPIIQELQSAHSQDPVVAYWLAEAIHGMGQYEREAQAWERVLQLTKQADAACPALPEAYANAGDPALALDAYERCAKEASVDPERWLDLGTALSAEGRSADAEVAFAKSRALDPSNPRLPVVRAGAEPPQVTGP